MQHTGFKKSLWAKWAYLLPILFGYVQAYSQLPEKEINEQIQFWTSLNSTSRISDRWAIIGDIHIRRNNGISDPSFYLLRFAPQFAILPNFTVAAGYAHMWIAPSRSDWQAYVNEHRLYQQAIFTTKLGSTNLLQRVRNEQRWQQIIADDKPTGDWRFTNRVRYLISVTIPVSKNQWVPKPVIAEEILFHFGKPIVYNTFDQNRLFLGIRQKLSSNLNFDFGYMNVYQQKFSGFQYDMNHTIRLFFYYTPDFRKVKKEKSPNI
ncbi:MAG: DUF2490 domain-containing protein, partial [Chitinophagaceae bacterium]|nr:DUF2490 domain-containing protein [Chitinophagaceae bacterium]